MPWGYEKIMIDPDYMRLGGVDEEMELYDPDLDEWCCPKCGWDSDGHDGYGCNVRVSDVEHLNNPELPFSAKAWNETWTCQNCKHRWTFENCNY